LTVWYRGEKNRILRLKNALSPCGGRGDNRKGGDWETSSDRTTHGPKEVASREKNFPQGEKGKFRDCLIYL